MSIALATRGIICHTSSSATSLATWGLICLSHIVVEVVIGFGAKESPPTCTFIYTQVPPQVFDPNYDTFVSAPIIQIVGQKTPLLGSGNPLLANIEEPTTSNSSKLIKLTGSKTWR